MQLQDIIGARCLIGLSYYDRGGELIAESQLAGLVTRASDDEGISIRLQNAAVFADFAHGQHPLVRLPPSLSCWFLAPAGHYQNPETSVDIKDPDFLVNWDIHQLRENSTDCEQDWWEWVPASQPPQLARL